VIRNVFIQQRVDFGASVVRNCCELQKLADLRQGNVERAEIANELKPVHLLFGPD